MTEQAQHRLFPSFAGVALADILANGVAIIIMMIVITIMLKHEQEEKRLEQVEDVSVLLSRDIATSVVMNALPTSPPARLHDYHRSPLDREPQHALMPIIELHRDHIRNHYTGGRITRDELLLQDNAFDRYIKTLAPQQLLRMRVDIYSIRLFYIVMAILKDHKHAPNHWHFVGYPGGGGGVPGDSWLAGKGEQAFAKEGTATDQTGEGESDDGSSETDGERRGDNLGVPQNTALDSLPGGTENYPYDDLAFQSGGGQPQEAPTDLPGSISQPTGEREQTSDEMFNALAQSMADTLSGEGGRPQETRISRFRSARTTNEQQGGDLDELLKVANLRELLPALFAFMREIQAKADAGGATRLAEYDFRRDILPLLSKTQQAGALFDAVAKQLDTTPADTDAPVAVAQETDAQLRANALALAVNQRVRSAALVGNEAQPQRDDLPDDMRPTLHFSLYPAIYRGLRAPIKQDTMVLMPPEQNAPDEFRWRVVTLVSPAVDDFMTAFVFSALDDDGRLLLASEENALNIAGYRVVTSYPTLPFRNERWLLLLYGIPALLIALGVLRRTKKTA